jgi:signal transduction histidine kinase
LAALTTLAGAIVLGAFAIVHQREASRPIGEGALFQREASAAGSGFDPAADPAVEVRRIRNALSVEAVGLLGADGAYVAATSDSLVGVTEMDPFLRDLAVSGGFGAIAGPAPVAIAIDGVEEWPSGSVLYRVLQPLDGGGALVLHYDISQLLSRRAGSQGIQPLTVQAGAGAALLILLAIALWSARSAAVRRIRQHQAETVRLADRAVELERLNRQLDQARRDAERALALAEETNRIRSDFVMMINHELRTPLTSLITGTELLQHESVELEERDHVLADMSRDGQRLMGLIANILAVARIENRGLDYRLRSTPVGGLLAAVTAMTSAATVEGAVPEATVLTDPDGLVHLLVSLAENARSHGADRVVIRVGALPSHPADHVVGQLPAEAVCFRVEDDGPGIDPEFLPRAFEKFEKASFSSGTGLGLYVARLMVEAIEGAILVHTGARGTVMTVAVPRTTGAQVAA